MEKLGEKRKGKKFIKLNKTRNTQKNTFGSPLVDTTDNIEKRGKRNKTELILTQEEIEMLHKELLEAVKNQNSKRMKFILKFKDYGINVNAQDAVGRTTLWFAAFLGDMDMCKPLVESGADLDIQDMNGDTALMRAVLVQVGSELAGANGYTETIKYLLSAGANPLLKSKAPFGTTAYGLAEMRKDEEVKQIINGFEILWKQWGEKQAPILIRNINAAVRECSPDKIKELFTNL